MGVGRRTVRALRSGINHFMQPHFYWTQLHGPVPRRCCFRNQQIIKIHDLSSDQKSLMSRLTPWTRMIHHLHCLEATSHKCTTSSQTREFPYFLIHVDNVQMYLSPDRTSQKMVLAETQVEGIRAKAKGMLTI